VIRLLFVSLALVFATGPIDASDFAAHDLVFLTRDGCVNTARMRSRLDEALTPLNLSTDYHFIDADKLGPSDRRRGYGAPTVLYKNRDLFGKQPPVRAAALS
jgi:hypothetical protein